MCGRVKGCPVPARLEEEGREELRQAGCVCETGGSTNRV